MSLLSSLVLVLLCFSYHACNGARILGGSYSDPAATSHQENDQKHNPGNLSINALGEAKIGNKFQKKEVNKEYNDPKKNFQGKSDKKTESQAYVSWRVNRKKRGEKEPGFNLDYLPPKTHPPVHN